MLNVDEIHQLIERKDLIKGYVDLEKQLQPSGFDLSLGDLRSFESKGSVDFTNAERIIASTTRINYDEDDWYSISQGCYTVVYNEIVKVPLDIVAIARTRSTLLRNGATVETAVWDPGYHGRSSSLLVVHNPYGIKLKRNARIAQLIFFKINEVAEGYDGVFQKERVRGKFGK